jgi:hypothetical protein
MTLQADPNANAEHELRRAMRAALGGGTAAVVATVSKDGVPATALCTWVVAGASSSVAIALDHRSSAYVNIASGNTRVAMEVLADDLVIAARGDAVIARQSMSSVPFPCAAVIVHINEIRDHSVRGIRFHAPTYEFGVDKQHRGDVERAVFAELAGVLRDA